VDGELVIAMMVFVNVIVVIQEMLVKEQLVQMIAMDTENVDLSMN